jgi:hypothetical protein
MPVARREFRVRIVGLKEKQTSENHNADHFFFLHNEYAHGKILHNGYAQGKNTIVTPTMNKSIEFMRLRSPAHFVSVQAQPCRR